jgi:hypothetical protein
VIPLQTSGVLDTDLTNVTANELMAWGIENLNGNRDKEGSYAVRHGNQPVADFAPLREIDEDRENLFEKAFPCLFPYGQGGIESLRHKGVDFAEHVKWSLRYHDRCFRTHETFPFVAFGILQRRQALGSARVQMQRRSFDRDAQLLSTISVDRLKRAAQEEEENRPHSDEAVRLLKKHLFASSSRVQGSDQSRYQLRSQIWSTAICIGPPSLWITINPCDLHDPIVQVLAGEKIDMDNLLRSIGPDKEQRAHNVAQDPYAAAKFFHLIIKVVLETLFGITAGPFNVTSEIGVVGRVAAYFGVVESQGRGSLHLHLLLYLKDVPSSTEMENLLQQDSFRQKVVLFLKANIRSHLPGMVCKEDIERMPNNVEVAWTRPPNPAMEDEEYQVKVRQLEHAVVRAKQIHTCTHRRCLVADKYGRYYCKRNAPFELSAEDAVETDGRWHSKRSYGFLNGWMPALSVNVRCNNDAKLLTNGGDTRNVSFYVTSYQTKKQGKNYNLSAVMAKGYTNHVERMKNADYLQSLRDQQRLLLFRIMHAINREQELSAPMVMSYLMGWGDTFRSHHYSPVYWSTFTRALLSVCPSLRSRHMVHDSGPDHRRKCHDDESSEVRIGVRYEMPCLKS